MYRNKFIKSSLMLLLAIVLVFSSFPFQANVEAKKDNISNELIEAFKKKEQVTYIVRMKEKTNIDQVKRNGELAAKFSVGNEEQKENVIRGHVVHSLQENSLETQSNLVDYLEMKIDEKSVLDYHSFYIINAIEITSNKEVMKKISERNDVLSLGLNETYKLDSKVIDKQIKDTKSNENTDIPWNLKNINAPEAWDLGMEGSGVTVGIIDSGVDYEHEAIRNQWRGNDLTDDTNDIKYHWLDATYEDSKLPTDKNGHGTHVTGSVLGKEKDGKNKIGVAPKANWIAAKVFSEKGETSDGELLRAGEWMLAPGGRADLAPDIINNSWSLSGPGKNEYFREVVQAWRAVNILPIFAAGNTRPGVNEGGPGSVPAPANYPESFTVGALNEDNILASFSLQGPSPYDETKPEVSAPGESIRSAATGGGYAYMDGTSMASPHVAGLAALVLEANPSLNVNELEEVLKGTATSLTDKTFPSVPNNGYGYGIVNALNAVSTYTKGLGELVGEVTIEGEDNEAPEIFHTALDLTFNVLNQEIYAQVKDNIGINSVNLEIRTDSTEDWKSIDMNIIKGDSINGEYEGVIPVADLKIPSIEYRLIAIDYSGNEAITEIFKLNVSEGVTKGYLQNFEQNIDGIDFQGNDIWEWGNPTSGPGSAYSGEKVMATNLSGTYENGSEGMLVLPLMDLRNETKSTVLSYAHWYKLGHWMMAEHDTAEVYVGTKIEGKNEFDFKLMKLYDYSQREWKKDYIDLTPYLGEQILVIFNLRGKHGTDLGWYLDDIELTEPEQFIPEVPKVSVRSNSPGRVIVEWPYIENDAIKDYVIYRSNHPTENFEEIASTDKRVFGDKPIEQKGTYYYYVKSRTYGNELSEASETVSWTFTGGEEIYSNDFEGDASDWTVSEGSDWELGVPKSNPSSAVSGQKAWGTNLNGNYKFGEHILTSPLIDLAEAAHATIYFQQWHSIDNVIGEYGYVEISEDEGETWNQLNVYPKNSYDSNHPNRFWYLDEINIDNYIGKQVQIRFRLDGKNANVYDDGWFIDDFEVRDTPSVKTVINAQQEIIEENQENLETEEAEEKTQLNVEPVLWDDIIEARKYKQTSGEVEVNTQTKKSMLPIGSNISILETNRFTKSNPGTGKYSMKHPEGKYKAKVDAYGYKSVEEDVNIKKGKITTKNFVLEPLKKSIITGVLTDALTGEPITNATIKVLEDMNVEPVKTDEKGFYSLEVYQGKYTLLTSALGYLSSEIQLNVGDNKINQDIQLKKYEQGDDLTLIYDDGSAENAVASKLTDAGYAVKMSYEKEAQLLSAQFYFWDEGWPTPGGVDFQYAVYDADGEEGKPGTLLAGPYNAKAKLDGNWTNVDMEESLVINGDYYIVYLQKGLYPNIPGLGIDTEGELKKRSWNKVGKRWGKEVERNYMIRSTIRPILGEKEYKVSDINIEPSSLIIKENQEELLHVTGITKEADIISLDKEKLTFKSFNEKIATVDKNGKVKGLEAGNTEIEVKYENINKLISVKVEEPGKPDPEEPGKPDPEEPGKPDPEEPGKPDPKEPGNPDPKEPGNPDPKEPGKPDPKEPGKPDPKEPGKPDPKEPGKDNKNKTEINKPSKSTDEFANAVNSKSKLKETKKKLPNTATNIYNILFISIILIIIGIVIRKRRSNK